MRYLLYMLYLLPTAAVLVSAWFVIRAISIRVVWRERATPKPHTQPLPDRELHNRAA